MTSREVRDRFRRDYAPRSEEKTHHGRSTAPPSRNLWVGNLSHDIDKNALANHFLKFGEVESVGFQPGRSYAFIKFRNEEEAFAAMRALQGFVVAGNPLRIEFTKADKSSTSSHQEDYLQRRDDQRSVLRGSSFSERDSRTFHSSSEISYPDNPKISDTNEELPSEVLWIGFPSSLKVDDVILRKAFSPFGDIEKVTTFPGRSYAFVRFKDVIAAYRAKETLQGKLLGNPRVHICFAKSESGSSNSGKNSTYAPPSPPFKSHGRAGSSEKFRQDRNFGSIAGESPIESRFFSNLESGDPDVLSFSRKGNLWTGVDGAFEQRRFQEPGPELGLKEIMHGRSSSPRRDRGAHFRNLPPQQFPRNYPFYDTSWDLPEDDLFSHGPKKLKTGSFPPENELPEYPLNGPDQTKHGFPRIFPPEALNRSFESGPYGHNQIRQHAVNLTQPYGERMDHRDASYDTFREGSAALPLNSAERKRPTPESHKPPLTKEWKWEGTIAKGGTPVCQARCFPVGKPMDMTLPEFIDCTARTSLDMIAKHYYQAASAWVIFFVPASDADIGFYNEFLHYLGEKQRAAVAKLDERTTLFLVPPSEFSEKVLKVAGDLSISGVILRLEPPGSNLGSSHQRTRDRNDTGFVSYQGEAPYPKPTPPSGPFPSPNSFPDVRNPAVRVNNLPFPGNWSTEGSPALFPGTAHGIRTASDSDNENRNDYVFHQQNPSLGHNLSAHHLQNSNFGARNKASQSSNTDVQGYSAIFPRVAEETSYHSYPTEVPGNPSVSSPLPAAALPPEHLAQLASSLHGQPRQSQGGSALSMREEFRQPSSSTMNRSENSYGVPEKYALQQNKQVNYEHSSSQFGQAQMQQQAMLNAAVGSAQREAQAVGQGSLSQQKQQQQQQQQQNGGPQEEEADPQKRLQATLQLAAALLQQIQQGKGTRGE